MLVCSEGELSLFKGKCNWNGFVARAVTMYVHVNALFVLCRVEYVRMGLDKNIIHPDKGANIFKMPERLQVSGVNEVAHPNLRPSPAIPNESWMSNLADLPFVSFATLYRHFVERTKWLIPTYGPHLQSQMKAGRQTWQICRLSPLPPCRDILWSGQPVQLC